VRESILIRIASDPVARVWSGLGDLYVPADFVEDEGGIYLGGGELISAPDFEQLINGTAQRLEITVSGVTAETIRLALEDAPSVKGADVYIGTVQFDDDWQQGAVTWEGGFRADTLTVNSQAADQGRTRSIALSIGTDDTGRSRAPLAFYTDADQKRRSPTDRFFERVASISAGTSRRFGPS
jgi:hypothetical protein